MGSIILDILSAVGSVASMAGIYYTLKQVRAVKSVAEATKEAAENTQKSVLKTLSIVQVTKYCESIPNIQQAIREDEIKLALHLCHELKTALIEVEASLEKCEDDNEECDLSRHIKTLGININNMNKALAEKKENLRKTKILQDLELLHNIMSEIQVNLKLKTK